jgi:hypothetical protein
MARDDGWWRLLGRRHGGGAEGEEVEEGWMLRLVMLV